jgi:hypothetical protein
MAEEIKRTSSEWSKLAVALEREFKWSEAAHAYKMAARTAKHPPARQAALSKMDTVLRTAADQGEDTLAGPPPGAIEAAMPKAPTEPPAEESSDEPSCEHLVGTPGKCSYCLAQEEAPAAEPPPPIEESKKPAKKKKEPSMASKTAETGDREVMLAKKERARMKQSGVVVGMELQHVVRGKTVARCTYAAERQFVVDGKVYTSLSLAAKAVAEKLGKHGSVNGWLFWGIDKREV